MSDQPRILVIKHAGLSQCVYAMAAMKAIRAHHPNAHITLMTSDVCLELAEACPHVDAVWLDILPNWWEVKLWWKLREQLGAANFAFVYDLDNSSRSHWYFRLTPPPKPPWSATIGWCSHPYTPPDVDEEPQTLAQFYEGQLAVAGIDAMPHDDLAWLDGGIGTLPLPNPYALIAPGGMHFRKGFGWSHNHYRDLLDWIGMQGIGAVVVGKGAHDRDICGYVARETHNSKVINLHDQTSLGQIAALARGASFAVGNNMAATHIASVTGCPSLFFTPSWSGKSLLIERTDSNFLLAADDVYDLPLHDAKAMIEVMVG